MNDKLIRRLRNLKYAIDTVIDALENGEPEEYHSIDTEKLSRRCDEHDRPNCYTCTKQGMCMDVEIRLNAALEKALRYKKALLEIREMDNADKAQPFKMWQIAEHALFEPSDIRGFVKEYTDVKWSNFPLFTGTCAECTDKKKCAAHACSGCGARKKKFCTCSFLEAPYGTYTPWSKCIDCGIPVTEWPEKNKRWGDPECKDATGNVHECHSLLCNACKWRYKPFHKLCLCFGKKRDRRAEV